MLRKKITGAVGARALATIGAGLLVVVVLGCGSAPVAQLSGYTAAFDQARVAGEEMLLDFSVVKAREDERIALEEENSKPDQPKVFDVVAAAREDGRVDHVGIRFRAWEIAEKYNKALVVYASGGREADVEASLNGFVSSLERFPIQEVADVAGELVPYAGFITLGIELIEQAIAQRNFEKALEEGAPRVSVFLNTLLVKDAQIMYNIRSTTIRRERSEWTDQLSDLCSGFGTIASGLQKDEIFEQVDDDLGVDERTPVTKPLNVFNAAVSSVRDWDPDYLPFVEFGEEMPSNAKHAQLQRYIESAKRLSATINGLDAELLAYQSAITEYVRLLYITDEALQDLMKAAVNGSGVLPSLENLTARAVQLKQAIAMYKAGG